MDFRNFLVSVLLLFVVDVSMGQINECILAVKSLQVLDTSYAKHTRKYDYPLGIDNPINPTSHVSDSSYYFIMNYRIRNEIIDLKINEELKQWMEKYCEYWDLDNDYKCDSLSSLTDYVLFKFPDPWIKDNSSKYVDSNQSEFHDTIPMTLEINFSSMISSSDRQYFITAIKSKDITGSIYLESIFIFKKIEGGLRLIDYQSTWL